MKITNHNANILLFDKITSIDSDEHHNWRCIHLQFSGKQNRYSPALRAHFVVKTMVDALREAEGNIYLCDDGDIFILFQGVAKPIVAKLSSHFADLVPDQEEGKADGLFTIYDLSKGWRNFYDLCHGKYKLAVRSRREKHKAALYSGSIARKANNASVLLQA